MGNLINQIIVKKEDVKDIINRICNIEDGNLNKIYKIIPIENGFSFLVLYKIPNFKKGTKCQFIPCSPYRNEEIPGIVWINGSFNYQNKVEVRDGESIYHKTYLVYDWELNPLVDS